MLNVAIYVPKNFYLFEPIRDSISRLHSAGIVEKIVDEFVDMRYWNVKHEVEDLKPLSMTHLEGTFNLWLIMNFASFVIFIFEKISEGSGKKISRLRKRRKTCD